MVFFIREKPNEAARQSSSALARQETIFANAKLKYELELTQCTMGKEEPKKPRGLINFSQYRQHSNVLEGFPKPRQFEVRVKKSNRLSFRRH